jgi:hypothetical protein
MSSVGGNPGFDSDELCRSFGVAADGMGLGGDLSESRDSDFCGVCWLDGQLASPFVSGLTKEIPHRSGLVEETAHSFMMLEEVMFLRRVERESNVPQMDAQTWTPNLDSFEF